MTREDNVAEKVISMPLVSCVVQSKIWKQEQQPFSVRLFFVVDKNISLT